MSQSVNTDKVKEILRECTEKYVLPRYKALQDHEIDTKSGPNDLVTQADLDVEQHLARVLPDILPGSVVIGEESVSQGVASLDTLQDTSRPVWVVDPVDGTHNFVHGKREFGIMLACVIDGITQYGFIHDVLDDETAIAERGAGAYFGNKKLSVAPVSDAPEGMSGHINPRFFPPAFKDELKDVMKTMKDCYSLHCAAHEYLRLASGQTQFVVYSRQKPWDHLPGVLLTQEAGGYVASWGNQPYTPQDKSIGLIGAASTENWQATYDAFLKGRL